MFMFLFFSTNRDGARVIFLGKAGYFGTTADKADEAKVKEATVRKG
jgi:hypothetical protein